MVRGYLHYCHPSYFATFVLFCFALLLVFSRPPDSKFDSKATVSSRARIPECFPQAATCSNASSKAHAKTPELKLYHEVTFDRVKAYNLTLAVHPAIEEARA